MIGVTVVGVRGHLVAVEPHVGRGLPPLMTGMPEAGMVAPNQERLRFLG